jgi:hypothetical protein
MKSFAATLPSLKNATRHHFLTIDIRGFNNRGIEQFGDELEFELLPARESDA